MTVKDIEKMEAIHRQNIALAEQGLKECAKWRSELRGGTPRVQNQQKKKQIDEAVANAVAKQRLRFQAQISKSAQNRN